MKLPTYILAGGRSSRFGSDKARAVLDGQPLIRRIADRAAPIASRVTVIADAADKYADLGLTTIADVQPTLGPIGGLLTALADLRADEDWLLLLSCDLVSLEASWVQSLLDRRAGAPIVAFKPDQWQPLLALYHRSTAPEVDRRAKARELAMWKLLDALHATAAPTPTDWPTVLQVNSPRELQQLSPQHHVNAREHK